MNIRMELENVKEFISVFEAFAKAGKHIQMDITCNEMECYIMTTAADGGDVVQHPDKAILFEKGQKSEESVVVEADKYINALRKLTGYEEQLELSITDNLVTIKTMDDSASIKIERCNMQAMEICLIPECQDMLINTCIDSLEFATLYKKGGYITNTSNAEFSLCYHTDENIELSIITQESGAIIATSTVPVRLHPFYESNTDLLNLHKQMLKEHTKEKGTKKSILFGITITSMERIAKILLNYSETISIALYKKHVMFQTQSVTITTPMEIIEPTFFDGVNNILGYKQLAKVTLMQSDVVRALTVIGIEGKKNSRLFLRGENGVLILASQNDTASVKVPLLNSEGHIDLISYCCSVEMLEKAVNHLEKKEICIQVIEEKSLIFLYNGDVNDSFQDGTILFGIRK